MTRSGAIAAVAVPVVAWRPGGGVAALAAALARGAILALPTESSYGLAVAPDDARGVEAIYRVKERERGKPLPVVAADLAAARSLPLAATAEASLEFGARHWPAALSLLLPLARPLAAAAGAPEIALRVPDHLTLRALLAALATPVTATSANPSGGEPLLDPAAVAAWLGARGADAVVVDFGAPLAGGAPSTLVRLAGDRPVVLRAGRFAIPAAGGGGAR
jgi:L-threonylcarbamoyladenylate synthase